MPRKAKDLMGQRFGRLVVVRRVERPSSAKDRRAYWYCECDCGGNKIVQSKLLINGTVKSCNCLLIDVNEYKTKENLVGNKYGKLIVESLNYYKNRRGYWNCNCECGGKIVMDSASLKSGRITSCNCDLQNFDKNIVGIAAINALYGSYLSKAKGKDIVFELKKEEFEILTQSNCYYCGEKPSNIKYLENCKGFYVYNGIDRVNSLGGYILDNVVPCCTTCNKAKLTMSTDEFKSWIKRVYNHLNL